MPSTTLLSGVGTVIRSPLRPGAYDEDVRRLDERVQPDVVVLSPRPRLARQLVVHLVAVTRLQSESRDIDMHRGLTRRGGLELDHEVRAFSAVPLAERDDLLVAAPLPVQVAQPVQGGMR